MSERVKWHQVAKPVGGIPAADIDPAALGGGYVATDKYTFNGGTTITLNATAISEVAAGTNGPGTGVADLVLSATVGNLIEYGISASLSPDGQTVGFEVYTMDGSTRVNPLGAGLSASLASLSGIPSWFANNTAASRQIGGVAPPYEVLAGDIFSGVVTLRLFYAKATTTNRFFNRSNNVPAYIWAKNLG